MKLKVLFIVSALYLCISSANAQTTSTPQNHAHSSSRQWKGIDVLDVLNNPGNYPGVTDKNIGIPVYLYNVGTGRFVIDGGDYGMEGRLFHEDFGRKMKLIIQDGVLKINPDIAEKVSASNQKYLLTCNIPYITREPWSAEYTFSRTTIMDGYAYWGKWNFQRIPSEDENSEFHTYYMYQQHNEGQAYSNAKNKTYQSSGVDIKNILFRYGAAYGEWCSDGTTTYGTGSNASVNDKGCGYYVHIDDDRSVWTTAGNANSNNDYGDGGNVSPWGNTTEVLVNGDMVTIDELYQWRIISEEEFIQVLNQEVVGINPSVSSFVPDRDFTRNSDEFFGVWTTTPSQSTTPAEGEGRYGYTWGEYKKNNTQNKNYINGEAWDRPLLLKIVFNNIKNAKFGFMAFEGVGTASVEFTLPQPGWYQIEANAISFSDDGNPTYMFGKANWVMDITTIRTQSNCSYLGYGQVELTNVPNLSTLKSNFPDEFSGVSAGNLYKSRENCNAAIGKVLTFKGSDFCHKFWVYVNPTDFNASADNKKFTLGFIKENAKKSAATINDGTSYYYDEDWICVDDIRMSYMGLAPAFFYEDEESLDYLVYESGLEDERPSAVPDGLYSGAVSLERSLKKNDWNSFSFPIPLTGEQVRLAFGEDAELLKLDAIYNNQAGEPYLINFETVNLKQTVKDPEHVPAVIEPGYFYLLKPTADPVVGEDPKGRLTQYYQLGRNFFSVDESQVPEGYAHTIINTATPFASQPLSSPNDTNNGTAYVSYVRTRGMYNADGSKKNPSDFLDANGKYKLNDIDPTTEFLFVPKGGYALTTKNGKQVFVEVNKDTPLKGFRAWLTLEHSLFTPQTPSEIKVSFNGIADGEVPTVISEMIATSSQPADGTTIYDLCGRPVGNIGETTLPRGFYIVGGKKIFVK